MRITAQNYPAIHEAFENISHDGGGRAGWAWYDVPDDRVASVCLTCAEDALRKLTSADLQTFSIGEDSERAAMKFRAAGRLDFADFLLESFFDSGWCRGGRK